MVDIGARADTSNGNFFNGTADLMIGTTVCAAIGTVPSLGSWSVYTAQCTSTEAGDPIVIQLNSSGSQADFDNVQLTDNLNTAATPEPASFFLMGSGLLAMGQCILSSPDFWQIIGARQPPRVSAKQETFRLSLTLMWAL